MPAPTGPSAFAAAESGVLQFCPPDRISNQGAVLLTWTDGSAGTASHRIEKSIDAGATWLPVVSYDGANNAGVASAGATSLLVGRLALNQLHSFRIRAEADGASAWSTAITHTTPALPTAHAATELTAPSVLALGAVTNREATLTWEDNSIGESYFELELRVFGRVVSKYFVATTESATVDIADAVKFDTANLSVTARVRAVGGKANAKSLPPWASAWSNELTFAMGAPNIRIISRLAIAAEKGVALSRFIETNTPATAFSVTSGTLPSALALNGTTGELSGTPAAAGVTAVTIQAGDGVTTDARVHTITVSASRLQIISPATATAPLGEEFNYTIRARNVLTNGQPPTTFAAAGLPSWLTRTDAVLSGTPTEPGEYLMQVSASSGAASVSQTLTVVVPEVAILGSGVIAAYLEQDLAHQLLASPSGVEWSISDGPEWLTLDGSVLRGIPDVLGETSVDVTATIGDRAVSRTIDIAVGELFDFGGEEIEVAYKDSLFYTAIAYLGAGTVIEWQLSGAPAGLGILTEAQGEPYPNLVITSIKGTPVQSGIFTATATAVVRMADESIRLARRAVTFAVNGDLFIHWLHTDPSLYDLQVQLRGDAYSRRVQSYYGTPAVPAKTTVETVANGPIQAVTTSVTPETPANLLTLKRGDVANLAIVVKDGAQTLGDTVTAVRFTLREEDAVDEEYVFDVEATPVTIGIGRVYFSVEFAVTAYLLDELMGGADLKEITLLGEISGVYNGTAAFSSGTFGVHLVEDVHR